MRQRILIVSVVVSLVGGLIAAVPAQATVVGPSIAPPCSTYQECSDQYVDATSSARREAVPSVAPDAVLAAGAPCEDDPASVCGTVDVPLNWREPDGRTIAIAWQFIPHTTPEPAVSTMAFIGGGPGDPTIFFSVNYAQYLMDGRIGEHDVLAVDQRGRGRSEALDCPELQHATGSWPDVLAACAQQLGADVDLYGSASNARDLDAVRAALGIEQLDLYPLSYGGADALAYASRFGDHVRSIVLGAAVDVPGTDVPLRFPDNSAVVRRTQEGLCAASPTCTTEHQRPSLWLGLAAQALLRRPLTGTAADKFGVIREVTVTASKLTFASAIYGDVSTPGWVAGAARSYLLGDTAPLLRTIANLESSFELQDSGEPSEFSAAINVAQLCADVRKPWADGLGYDQRIAVARNAVASASWRSLLPFTAATYTAEPDWTPEGTIAACAHWPDTHAEPVVLPGATLPDVPVLAVTGEYDGNVAIEETERLASRFPSHESLTIPSALHPAGFFRCAPAKVAEWLVGFTPVTPGCEGDDQPWAWYLQPSFPRTASQVSTSLVQRGAGDASTASDRRIVQAVWRSVFDGWMQTNNRFAGYTNPGLRGGSMTDAAFEDRFGLDYTDYRFVSDVAVSGHLDAFFFLGPESTVADLTVVGPRGVTGELHIVTDLHAFREGLVTITGTLGGRTIALTTDSR